MLVELIESMSPAERAGALKALDACTRPLDVREIERALRNVGVPSSRAVAAASALKKIAIVAVVGERNV